MRILLSDGSGLTSRQCAWLLARAGHDVGVCVPPGFSLSRTTAAVRRRHTVPRYGDQPLAWFDAAVDAYRTGGYDVLLPTQEQVAVLSLRAPQLSAAGVATMVPAFSALRRAQDKVSAEALLTELGLPRPRSGALPAYVKAAVGTASAGVRYVTDQAGLELAVRALGGPGQVVVQEAVPGAFRMVQAVFDRGRLVAAHANSRDRAGAGNGATSKTSVAIDPFLPTLELLGAALGWHGALSLDVIVGPDGPTVIDVNPRLVEPGNATAAGVDLISPMLDIAVGMAPPVQAPGRVGVRTHQLPLALVSAATAGRARVLREVLAAMLHTGPYRDSREELVPATGDLRAAATVLAISAALLARPGWHERLAGGAVAGYALDPAGWLQLLAAAEAPVSAGRPAPAPPRP